MHTSRAFLVLCTVGALLMLGAPACTGSATGGPGGGNPGGGNPGGGGGGGGGGSDAGPDGGGGGGGGGGSDGGSVLACVQQGSACVSGMPCCSGICDGTVCAVAEFCQANGGACSTNTDCCLNSCVNGTCSDKICKDVGQGCSTGNDCCTGTCTGGTCANLPGGSCKVIGQACSSGSQCCSTNCQSGFCAMAYSCQAVNDICRSNDECCGHACSANNDGGVGHCLNTTGGGGGNCTQAGEPCSNGSNCCSRFCTDPGSGVTVCQAAEGCRLTGTWCTDTASCCGGGDPTSQVECNAGTCDNGNSCAPSGNICGAPVVPKPDGGFGSINANQDCCNGKISSGGQVTPGKDVCKLDGSGIPRCYGGISQSCPTGYTGEAGCCVATGGVCNFKDECCGGAPCLPGQDGVTRCSGAPSCKPVGDTCQSTNDCCSGTSCRPTDTGVSACQPIPPPPVDAGTPDAGSGGTPDAGVCNANGATCSTNADCCSDRCIGDPGNRTCQAPLACQPQGSTCTSTADCCSGYSCSIPNGSTTGTCQTSSCTGAGQACTVNDQCCTGLSCLDSTNYYCSGTGDCTCRALLN